jgi:hypothetical protein
MGAKDRWSDELGCFVAGVAYHFRVRAGRLDMPEGVCCDMEGCIDLICWIDPDVCRIETYAGGARDTFYLRNGEEWRARILVTR